VNLDHAVVYDIETICNCYTLSATGLFAEWEATFEISEFRDDRALLAQWFEHWRANQVPMIGFNNLAFDYPILHFLWQNPGATVEDIYSKAQEQIHDRTMFKTVRPSDCFAPQIDLFSLWHFRQPREDDQPKGAAGQHAVGNRAGNAATVRRAGVTRRRRPRANPV
jgi:hypothetical protein